MNWAELLKCLSGEIAAWFMPIVRPKLSIFLLLADFGLWDGPVGFLTFPRLPRPIPGRNGGKEPLVTYSRSVWSSDWDLAMGQIPSWSNISNMLISNFRVLKCRRCSLILIRSGGGSPGGPRLPRLPPWLDAENDMPLYEQIQTWCSCPNVRQFSESFQF